MKRLLLKSLITFCSLSIEIMMVDTDRLQIALALNCLFLLVLAHEKKAVIVWSCT